MPAPTVLAGLDVSNVGSALACVISGLPAVHVLTIERHRSSFALTVETVPSLVRCPNCGVLAVGHRRVPMLLHDLPCAGVPVRVVWRKRRYRCHETAREVTTFCELHELVAPRGKLTTRAIGWAVAQLRSHDIAVSALAHMLGVAWNTVWDAVNPVVRAQLAGENQLAVIDALGVDEHVWGHVHPPGTEMVTGIVDHSRDEAGRPRARLLDPVKGRTGAAYDDRLTGQGETFRFGIRTATLDRFHGYANAICNELPEAITVLDAFHVVNLGGQIVDEVRRCVQQDSFSHRGRAGDRYYETAAPCRSGRSTLPSGRSAGSTRSSKPGTRISRSLSPGTAIKSCAPSTTSAPSGDGGWSPRL